MTTDDKGAAVTDEGAQVDHETQYPVITAADRLAEVVEDILADQTRARRETLMGALLDYHKARR